MIFDIYCATYKLISLGPKISLETNVSKKGYLPSDKKISPTFIQLIECNKPQRAIYKVPQGFGTITVEVLISTL